MGLNLVIGCHLCKEQVWFFRGHLEGMEFFYRNHWDHAHAVELSDDQSSSLILDYRDARSDYPVWEPEERG